MSSNIEKPSFLCIGAQKAATSWLNETLKLHPQIWLPPIKELHYFDHLYVENNRSWTKNHIDSGVKQALYWYCNNMGDKSNFSLDYAGYLLSYSEDEMFTEDWYITKFQRRNGNKLVKGDITPEYSTIPEEGVQYVKELLGKDLKIIYIVRDPVDRALSQFKMHIDRANIDVEKFSNKDWFDLLDSQISVIKNRGDYRSYIPRWKHHFGDNLMLIAYKDISANPEKVTDEICSFINVEQGKIPFEKLTNRVHKTKSIAIPEDIKKELKVRLSSQYDFLESEFSKDFMSAI